MGCQFRGRQATVATVAAVFLYCCGCTGPLQYIRNGFKVGPNYGTPPAPVAEHWIDAADIRSQPGEDLSRWWTVFNDTTLDRLVALAYGQNLSLREAGFRVLAARAQRAIAVGELFPQQQDASGGYAREARSKDSGPFSTSTQFFDQWNLGFNLAWELDFWGRFRRAVAAADRLLDASVEDYDEVLVTLLGDVADNYVQVRTLQERIRLLRHNVELQRWVLSLLQQRLRGGFRATERDYFEVIEGKTASLFGWACSAGGWAAGAEGDVPSALGRFGEGTTIVYFAQDGQSFFCGHSAVACSDEVGSQGIHSQAVTQHEFITGLT